MIEKKEPTEKEMIAELLLAKVLFHDFIMCDFTEETICLFVNCNDLFAWRNPNSVDVNSQSINSSGDLKNLYESWKRDSAYGIDLWCCMKRQMQPQKVIKDIWKKNGIWNDELENLKLNPDSIN